MLCSRRAYHDSAGNSRELCVRNAMTNPPILSHCRYVVSVSYFKDNLFVRAFHPPTRTVLPYMIRMTTVLDIFGVPKSTLPHFYPGILNADSQALLGEWLASELSICRGYMCQVQAHAPYHMVGKPALMLEIIEASGRSPAEAYDVARQGGWVQVVS